MRRIAYKLVAVGMAVGLGLAGMPATALADGGDFVPTTAEDYAVLAQSDVTLQAMAPTWDRLYGADRYQTMGAIVGEGFESSGWAVVATGQNFPDALGASALAGVLDCPVILTRGESLSPEAAEQLQRLGVSDAYLTSGTAALSARVEASIEDLGIATHRLAGDDRYETNLQTYEAVRGWGSDSSTVVVASGTGFADALSIGPWAYATASPIVITRSDGTLDDRAADSVRSDGHVTRVLLVGGQRAVSDEVRDQLGDGYEYVRLAGDDRYETSEAVAAWEVANGLGWSIPALANGQNFPDALAGAALCGRVRSVLLLGTKVSHPTVRLLYENRDAVVAGNLLGGTSTEPLFDPIAEYEQSLAPATEPDVLMHGVTWAGQPNSYFCGPTCGYMILGKIGATTSAGGLPLTIGNVANVMETSYYGYTSFTNHMFESGMNRWLGADVYQTVPNPSYEELRAAVLRSFETGYPMVVDEHERAGGPHFNGHGDGEYSHIMVVEGYNKLTDAVMFADPAAQVYWYGGSQKFWYPSLRDFAETYLVPYPWRDGIGMVCPR